jgi:putative salt-induced outer membrane protein YdiY
MSGPPVEHKQQITKQTHNMTKNITTRSMASAAALTASICAGAFVSGTAQAAEAAKGWETVANAGATLTRGNSETFLGTIGVNSQRKWSKDEVLLGASAGYGENTTRRPGLSDDHNATDQYVKGFGQWNHLFSERLYGGLRVDGMYDKIAGIDYRVTVSPMIGYYLIKDAKTTLAVEAGPGVVFENLAGTDSKGRPNNADQYITLRIAERFEHKFSDKAKVWQSAEYLPRISDFADDYVINAEVGASAAITSSIDLRAVLQDTYRSLPPGGRKHNDLKLIVGVGYRF